MNFIREMGSNELMDLGLKSDEQFLKPVLEDLPQQVREATELSDHFWDSQRAAIRSRIAKTKKPSSRPVPILAWACTGVLMAVAVLALQGSPQVFSREAQNPVRQLVQPAQTNLADKQVDTDHELLLEVEESIQSGIPSALAPASLLAQEMNAYATSVQSSNHKKEMNHEN